MVKIKDLLEKKTGDRVSVKFDDHTQLVESIVFVDLDGEYYLLQDEKDGSTPFEIDYKTFGKKYAWSVCKGREYDIYHNDITAIYEIESSKTTINLSSDISLDIKTQEEVKISL